MPSTGSIARTVAPSGCSATATCSGSSITTGSGARVTTSSSQSLARPVRMREPFGCADRRGDGVGVAIRDYLSWHEEYDRPGSPHGEIGGNIWNAERSLRSRHLSLDLDAFTHWARSRSRQAQGASSGL